MTPFRLSHTWSRRLYAVLFLLFAIYVTLFVLRAFDVVTLPESLSVDVFAGVAASIGLIASLVLGIVAKKVASPIPGLIVYLIVLVTTGYLIQQTGGVASLFAPVWALILFFAVLFGAFGWLPAIVLVGTYIASAYLNGDLSIEMTIAVLVGSFAPLLGGIVAWRHLPDPDEATSRNVKTLTSELSEVATRSEIIINAIGDGVIAIDGKGVIQLINPAAQEILGWGKQDALMLHYKSIFKLTDENNKELEPAQDPMQQVLNTNQQARGGKLIAVTKSGKKLSVALMVSPIGEPGSGAIAVFRDVTKERAEEREQAEFISTASHEMRTPVASIEGYLGLALNPNTATVDQRANDFIMKAHQAAQHLGRLFQDLLDVSKSEDGRLTNVPKVTDIVPFTQTIVQGLQQKATEKGLQLTFVPTDSGAQKKIMPVYYVNLDNDHIREVLDNLIENAIKYTPKGSVTVDVSGSDDKVVITVKDSGLGIPAEDIPHLFQKFYRVSNMDRQEIGGTGLGLYLSRRLVEGMQGRLWVESVFGSGSTFFVELPRITSEQAAQLKAQQDQQAAQQAQLAQATTPAASATAPIEPAALTAPVTTSQAIPQASPTVSAPAAPSPPQPPSPGARPATTVPRGESLTREQIAERVRQLEQLAQQQRAGQGRQ